MSMGRLNDSSCIQVLNDKSMITDDKTRRVLWKQISGFTLQYLNRWSTTARTCCWRKKNTNSTSHTTHSLWKTYTKLSCMQTCWTTVVRFDHSGAAIQMSGHILSHSPQEKKLNSLVASTAVTVVIFSQMCVERAGGSQLLFTYLFLFSGLKGTTRSNYRKISLFTDLLWSLAMPIVLVSYALASLRFLLRYNGGELSFIYEISAPVTLNNPQHMLSTNNWQQLVNMLKNRLKGVYFAVWTDNRLTHWIL